jgi:Zn-dependent protease
MTTPPEPRQTSLDVRFSLGGVTFRIHPNFWLAAALLGVRYYLDPEAGSFGYFAFWIIAATVCVLLRAWAQVCIGRRLGMRGSVVLFGLGSQIRGVELLPRCWKRCIVFVSGPFVQLLIAACLIGLVEVVPFPESLSNDWRAAIATGFAILIQLNLAWGLLTLAPIWPLDGGRAAVDVGETLLGQRGKTLALLISLVIAALLSMWVVMLLSWHLSFPFDPRYLLHLGEGVIHLLFCFLLWLCAFRALWPDDSRKELSHENAARK